MSFSMCTIGSKDRKQFTVMGDAVNIAARLESKTKDISQKLLISRNVYDALPTQTRLDLVSLGETNVKGKSQPVAIYGL